MGKNKQKLPYREVGSSICLILNLFGEKYKRFVIMAVQKRLGTYSG